MDLANLYGHLAHPAGGDYGTGGRTDRGMEGFLSSF